MRAIVTDRVQINSRKIFSCLNAETFHFQTTHLSVAGGDFLRQWGSDKRCTMISEETFESGGGN